MFLKPKARFLSAKKYHSLNSWKLNKDGIRVPHSYDNMREDEPSWWDDFGFIYGKRRIMVWWIHPRMKYNDILEEMAWNKAEENPRIVPRLEDLRKSQPRISSENWRRILRRTYLPKEPQDGLQLPDNWQSWRNLVKELSSQDLGIKIPPSCETEEIPWAQGLNVVLPVEVHCEADLVPLKDILEEWLSGNRKVLSEFPVYTSQNWLEERERYGKGFF